MKKQCALCGTTSGPFKATPLQSLGGRFGDVCMDWQGCGKRQKETQKEAAEKLKRRTKDFWNL